MSVIRRCLLLLILLSPVYLPAQDKKPESFNRKLFRKETKNERADKNLEFLDREHSPLPPGELKSFKGLNYFPANINYKVRATFQRIDMPLTFRMKTTTDRQPEYRTFARITFKLMDSTFTLNVYQNVELTKKPGFEDYLFVPFTDETSAEASYGGGRFMDLRMPASDTIEVDFNKAYNPYCAYNHKYSCPIPPSENHLPVLIKAGEKKYK
jgi:uncharacterized protein